MTNNKITSVYSNYRIAFLVAIFVLLAFVIRTVLPFDDIFTSHGIKLSSIDAYYQVSIVDNWVHNFPSLTEFQPFLVFPDGQGYGSIHFFNFLLALIIFIIGLGSPSPHLIDVMSVYYPAILAALTVIPVYFIGKTLINRWAGLLAAAFFAVMPGEYLGRSILGFTDQHVMETLLTALAGMFFIMAIKTAAERQLSFQHVLQRDWKTITRPIIYSLLAGLCLGLYLISWLGALLFVFIIAVYFVIRFVIDHLNGRQTSYLGIVGFFVFFPLPLVIFWPLAPNMNYVYPLIAALLVPIVLAAISYFMDKRGLKTFWYPVGIVAAAGIFLLLFYLIAPNSFSFAFKQLAIFNPSGSGAETTMEMQPFLSPAGTFSTQVAWGNFTTTFFLFPWWPIPGFGLIGLVVLAVITIRNRFKESGVLFFLIWAIIMLILTLVQRRFAYYLVVNIAVLSACFSWLVIWWVGARYLMKKNQEPVENIPVSTKTAAVTNPVRSKKKKSRQAAMPAGQSQSTPGWTVHHTFVMAAVFVVMLAMFLPNILKSVDIAQNAAYAPSNAWQESLTWMKDNTPDPLGDPDAYYGLYDKPAGGSYEFPETAYAVTSWWDYGYWITRISHRIPNANPSQDPNRIRPLAQLLLSESETDWAALLEQMGTGYLIADNTMVSSKYWAIINWAGQDQSYYMRTYAVPQNGQLTGVTVYNQEYYRSLVVRLYNFDGKAVTETKPIVLEYVDRVDSTGVAYREVTQIHEYNSYEEAIAFIESQESGNFDIVGANPLESPIPLEAVEGFELVHASSQLGAVQSGVTTPEVKVFAYNPD